MMKYDEIQFKNNNKRKKSKPNGERDRVKGKHPILYARRHSARAMPKMDDPVSQTGTTISITTFFPSIKRSCGMGNVEKIKINKNPLECGQSFSVFHQTLGGKNPKIK